jgi:pimeloyl-ACP methyl ester carboxylesterase
VLYFNYRGSWGTPGDFSFGHSIEDVASAVDYLRQPDNAKLLRLDPKRIVLIGHSMGGFMAIQAAASDLAIVAVGTISASDVGGRVPQPLSNEVAGAFVTRYASSLENEGMAPLAGCSSAGLAREAVDNAGRWAFISRAVDLKDRPFLVITSDDGYAAANDAFVSALRRAGDDRITTKHFATDHVYSDQRLELSASVRKWLKTLAGK